MLADDHSVFRMGLRELLEAQSELEVVTEASSGADAVEKARQYQPDVVLMDILMPDMDGIEATRRIKREAQDTAVIVMSAVDDDQRILEAMQAGAHGYVTKDDEANAVVQAVRHAGQGDVYLPPIVAKRILDRVSESLRTRKLAVQPEPTPFEQSMLRMMAEGKRYREIAADLGVSERRVGSQLGTLYHKLRLKSRADAIQYAVRRGIVRI